MKGSFRLRLLCCAFVVILGFLASSGLAQEVAQPAEKEKPKASAVLVKTAPASVEELRAIQEQVKVVLKKVVPATVGIQLNGASGSGVIIDAEGHVLTAGHVSGPPNRDCTLILPS